MPLLVQWIYKGVAMRPVLPKATQQQTRLYNSQLVLKTIYDRTPISRAEVARLTHLTRTTVSDVVAELQEKGLVEEIGHGPSGGGRSPILLSVARDARHLITIDLGNDEFRGAVVNLRGEMRHTISRPIPRGGDAALALVYTLIDDLVAGAERPLLGIGLGTPGLVDTTSGRVLRAVNLEWRDLPLGSLLQERYQLPVYVANDSQLTALALYMFGGEPDTASLVAIKVGHGVGAGIILNGHLFQGDGFGAGEIGHVVVADAGQPCRCGNAGCLETVVNDEALRARALAAGLESPSAEEGSAAESAACTIALIRRALAAGDPCARQIVAEIGQYLGIGVAYLIGALNIRRVVVVGSLTEFGAPLLAAVRREALGRALPALAQQTVIEFAPSNPDIVLLGASALLLTRELGLSLAR